MLGFDEEEMREERREMREKRGGKREESGSHNAMWRLCQQLPAILTSFESVNVINYSRDLSGL